MNIVGFRASDTLAANSLIRLTLSANTGWLSMLDSWMPSMFPSAAQDLYNALFQTTQMRPTSPLNVTSDSSTAVFDALLYSGKRGADLINACDMAHNRYAAITTIEVLSGADRSDASGDDGASQRDNAQAEGDAKVGADSPINKTLAGLQQLGSVIKWGGVGIAILAVLYFGAPLFRRND